MEPVLVLLSEDGWVEVYAARHVRVRIVERLATEDDEAARLADDYLYVSLKEPWRGLYETRWLRGEGRCTRTTAEEEIERRSKLDFLKVLRLAGPMDVGPTQDWML